MKVYLYYDASHVHSYDENGIDVIELLPGTTMRCGRSNIL